VHEETSETTSLLSQSNSACHGRGGYAFHTAFPNDNLYQRVWGQRSFRIGGFMMLTTHGRVGSCERIAGVDGLDSATPINTPDNVLAGLSRLEKLILTLTYYEGLTLRETGTILGLAEQEVRKTLASIERRFARALDEERAALEMA
jgi:predicted DNA-binding protein (UPF0251 family)